MKLTWFDSLVYLIASCCWIISFYLLYMTYKPIHGGTEAFKFLTGLITLVEVKCLSTRLLSRLFGIH